MKGYRLKKSAEGKQLILVDNFNDFITHNNNFKTDGEIYITGNKYMEFRVSGATYIDLPKVLLVTEEYLKNNKI